MTRIISTDDFYDDVLSNTFKIIASYDKEKELREKYGDQIFESFKKEVENYGFACFAMGDQNHHLDYCEFISFPDDTDDIAVRWDEE